MPAGAIYVGRPTPWGNPFPWHGDWIMWMSLPLGHKADMLGRRAAAVDLYRSWITGRALTWGETGTIAPLQVGPGELEYSDGTKVSMGEAVRGFGLRVASIMAGPAVPTVLPDLEPLRGHDLACWCPLDVPCHADVLLELLGASA